MMPSLLARVILFASSYSPLFVMLAILNDAAPPWIRVGLVIIAGLAVLGLVLFLRMAGNIAPYQEKIVAASTKDGEAMSYIVTYLIPFLGISLKDPKTAISMAILLAIVGIIYVNSNMIYTNPILNLGGYHAFQVTSNSGKESMLLTRRTFVKHDENLSVVSLGDYVLLEKVRP